MALSCRHADADRIAAFVKQDNAVEATKLHVIATAIHRGVRYVHSVVQQFPDRFALLPCITGKVGDKGVYLKCHPEN